MDPAAALLAIDVGNTAVKAAVIVAGQVDGFRRRFALADAGEIVPTLPRHPAALCTVIPERSAALCALLAKHGHGPPVVLSRATDVPLRHAYATPETLGADRLVAALAAWRELARASIVVDAGSALTVDFVDDDGVFRGGAIAPGLGTLGAALTAAAPRLDRVDPDADVSWPAHDSIGSCRVGVTAAARGLVAELLGRALDAVGADTPIVVTGGDAETVGRMWGRPCLLRPDLMFRGIAEAVALGASGDV